MKLANVNGRAVIVTSPTSGIDVAAGVGAGRSPQHFLRPGDVLVSWIDGVGRLRQAFVAAGE